MKLFCCRSKMSKSSSTVLSPQIVFFFPWRQARKISICLGNCRVNIAANIADGIERTCVLWYTSWVYTSGVSLITLKQLQIRSYSYHICYFNMEIVCLEGGSHRPPHYLVHTGGNFHTFRLFVVSAHRNQKG